MQTAVPPKRKSAKGLPCTVCGDVAHGVYFGATVCLPCKSFFIRCVKEDPRLFLCGGNRHCNVSRGGGIRCQYCRYQKCLAAGMQRKEKPEVIEPVNGQDLCMICGDIANGVHFGILTCEGCKKFFRRGLKESEIYICRYNKCCPINPRTRNECRYCRFQKCLGVGMCREGIKMGRPKRSSGNGVSGEKRQPQYGPSHEKCIRVHEKIEPESRPHGTQSSEINTTVPLDNSNGAQLRSELNTPPTDCFEASGSNDRKESKVSDMERIHCVSSESGFSDLDTESCSTESETAGKAQTAFLTSNAHRESLQVHANIQDTSAGMDMFSNYYYQPEGTFHADFNESERNTNQELYTFSGDLENYDIVSEVNGSVMNQKPAQANFDSERKNDTLSNDNEAGMPNQLFCPVHPSENGFHAEFVQYSTPLSSDKMTSNWKQQAVQESVIPPNYKSIGFDESALEEESMMSIGQDSGFSDCHGISNKDVINSDNIQWDNLSPAVQQCPQQVSPHDEEGQDNVNNGLSVVRKPSGSDEGHPGTILTKPSTKKFTNISFVDFPKISELLINHSENPGKNKKLHPTRFDSLDSTTYESNISNLMNGVLKLDRSLDNQHDANLASHTLSSFQSKHLETDPNSLLNSRMRNASVHSSQCCPFSSEAPVDTEGLTYPSVEQENQKIRHASRLDHSHHMYPDIHNHLRNGELSGGTKPKRSILETVLCGGHPEFNMKQTQLSCTENSNSVTKPKTLSCNGSSLDINNKPPNTGFPEMFDASYWTIDLEDIEPSGDPQEIAQVMREAYRELHEETSFLRANKHPSFVSTEKPPVELLDKMRNRVEVGFGAFSRFAQKIPDFDDIDIDDRIHLCKCGGFNAALVTLSREQFDPVTRSFDHLWEQPKGPDHPMGRFQLELAGWAEKANNLWLDTTEISLLNAVVIVASDWYDLKQKDVVEKVRAPLLYALKVYIEDKHGPDNRRLSRILSLIPQSRQITSLHTQITSLVHFEVEDGASGAVKTNPHCHPFPPGVVKH